MRLSARTEYAIQALVELSIQSSQEPVQARAIARNQQIPGRFLEQVLNTLRKAGLVESVRGAQGGYILARNPSEIRISEIVEALEGAIADGGCSGAEAGRPCRHQREQGECLIRSLNSDLGASVRQHLGGTTLKDLVERTNLRIPMFHI